MDLALRNRIDTDLEHFFIIDDTPTGGTPLDITHAVLGTAKNDECKRMDRANCPRQRELCTCVAEILSHARYAGGAAEPLPMAPAIPNLPND